MQPGFVQRHIARGNRNLLRLSLVLLALGGGLAALFSHWFPLLFAAVGAWSLGVWLWRVVQPTRHPTYRDLARWGDIPHLIGQVNAEFAGVTPGATAHLSATWLAQGTFYGVDLLPWPALAWIHPYTQVRNRVRTWYVRVRSRDGRHVDMPVAQAAQADQLLRELHARAPWAEVGCSPELDQQWSTDRAAFLARVDARKEAVGGTP
jgi:hypothetical protein